MFSIWLKQPTDPIHFCFQSIKFTFLYLIPVVSAGFFVYSLWQRHSSPLKALFYVYIFVSGGRQLCSLFYPVCQLHHVCRVDAEEDVQDAQFQSTLPHGEWLDSEERPKRDAGFNPHSRMGSDATFLTFLIICYSFNPHSRMGSDNNLYPNSVCGL